MHCKFNLYSILCHFIIPIVVLFILICIVWIIKNRIIYQKRTIKRNNYNLMIDHFLINIVFSSMTNEEIKSSVIQFIKEVPFNKNWFKKLVLKKLINLKQNLVGTDSKKIIYAYRYFGFHLISKKLILKNSWYNKSLGFYHYQLMDYKIKKGQIEKYIHSSNKFLKSNALIALIVLSDERFNILKNYNHEISTSDELKIIDIIYNKESSLPQEINNWLYNENLSIVLLTIKLAVRFRYSFNKFQIKKLISNTNVKVRKTVYLAIKDLIILDSNALLLEQYNIEDNKQNKIELLKTLSYIGNEITINHFSKILTLEQDLDLKFNMVRLIKTINTNYLNDFTFKSNEEQEVIEKMLLHVSNPYLN